MDLNGVKLKNRIIVSSGALGYGQGWPWQKFWIKTGLINPDAFGGIVTKTLTLEPRRGNYIDPFEFEKRNSVSHLCRIFSTERKNVLRKIPGGWINNLAWWNVGIDYWIKNFYPRLGGNIIASIGGFSGEEYFALIAKLNELVLLAVEINISCPNVDAAHNYALRRDLSYIFRAAKSASKHPLILKISSSEEDINLAQTASSLGFNAVSAINAVPGAVVLGNSIFTGGQSGRRIKETALEAIVKLKKALCISKVPIIGGGGISNWRDCQDFFTAGAEAVSLGSSVFISVNPAKAGRIVGKLT